MTNSSLFGSVCDLLPTYLETLGGHCRCSIYETFYYPMCVHEPSSTKLSSGLNSFVCLSG